MNGSRAVVQNPTLDGGGLLFQHFDEFACSVLRHMLKKERCAVANPYFKLALNFGQSATLADVLKFGKVASLVTVDSNVSGSNADANVKSFAANACVWFDFNVLHGSKVQPFSKPTNFFT